MVVNKNISHNVFLAIATNIPQRLKTGFVVQGHICGLRSLLTLCSLSFHIIIAIQSNILCKKNLVCIYLMSSCEWDNVQKN